MTDTAKNLMFGAFGNIWVPIQVSGSGALTVSIIDPATNLQPDISTLASDAVVPTGMATYSQGLLFNETSWDRERANTQGQVLASAARTASVNSADFVNYNARGLHCIINVSAIAATPSVIATIQGKDPVSGTYYSLLAGLPMTTTGIYILKVYPGISAVVGASASDLLPRTWRVAMTHGDADSITYSVGFALVL